MGVLKCIIKKDINMNIYAMKYDEIMITIVLICIG